MFYWISICDKRETSLSHPESYRAILSVASRPGFLPPIRACFSVETVHTCGVVRSLLMAYKIR